MNLAVEGHNALELSSELGKPTIGKSDGLGATATNGVKSSSGSRWLPKPTKLDQGELPINHELPRPSWRERLAQMLKRFQRALSRISQTLRNVFRIQVNNDSIYHRNLDLWELVKDAKSINAKVNGFMAKIRDSLPVAEDDVAYEAKVKELRISFHKLHDIQKVDDENYIRLVRTQDTFSEKIRPMLMRSPEKIRSDLLDQKLQPIAILAKRMAPLRSKSLAKDKKILSKVLPSDQSYMSSLLGQMGPKEVLKPWFKAVVREKVKSNELIFKQGEEQFIACLQLMQTALAGLAKLHQTSDLATLSKEDKALLNVYTDWIVELDKRLSDSFGGRDEFKASLKRIKSMNFHKGFMMELERPRASRYYNVHYNDLQFLEPLRYMGHHIREEEKKLIDKQLGIHIEEHDISTINRQAPTALANFKDYLNIFLKIREEEMKILNIISPNQLKGLTKYQIPEKGSKVVEDSNHPSTSTSLPAPSFSLWLGSISLHLALPNHPTLQPRRYQFLAAHHRQLLLPNTTGPRCPPSLATTALQLLPLQSRPLPSLPPDLASLILPLTSPLPTSHPCCSSLPLPPAADSPATQPARRPQTLQSPPTISTCNQHHHPEWQLQLATSANHQHPRYRCPSPPLPMPQLRILPCAEPCCQPLLSPCCQPLLSPRADYY
ncbi:hypothetical protein PCANC_28785 [Puccinia coronata f. sp. avenae]|uniref:Uncharacterized protein n=1 Tax=Puccinia coronata f. sp. avenae TaxID=200324 RepID=A0A2N5RUY0_9BASI|nr:hypothetical protein PCANC_28785 [Puccinia coronata f. sp. avenae]